MQSSPDQTAPAVIVVLVLAAAGWLFHAISRRAGGRPPPADDAPGGTGLFGFFGFLIIAGYGLFGVVFPPAWGALFLGLATLIVALLRGAKSPIGWWGLGALLPLLSVLFALLIPSRPRGAAESISAPAPSGGMPIDFDPFDGPAVEGYPSWVAGLAHRGADAAAVAAKLRSGDVLTIARDPFNPADPRALTLSARGIIVGFVPARHLESVFDAVDAGKPVSIRVHSLERVGGRVTQIWTRVIYG